MDIVKNEEVCKGFEEGHQHHTLTILGKVLHCVKALHVNEKRLDSTSELLAEVPHHGLCARFCDLTSHLKQLIHHSLFVVVHLVEG